MTPDKLYKRLQRITVPEKLQVFIEMAQDHGNHFLYQSAIEHREKLLNRISSGMLDSTTKRVFTGRTSGTTGNTTEQERYIDI